MPTSAHSSRVNPTVLLRQINIFTLPPAFVMFLIHGFASHYAFPALGILPLTGSAALGLTLLYRDRVASFGSASLALSPTNIFFADSALAIWLLGFLIPTIVFLGATWDDTGMVILGTYCSVFLIVNFSIHLYFALAEALHIITSRTSPFRSLAAEYTPLNSDYDDVPDDTEQSGSLA